MTMKRILLLTCALVAFLCANAQQKIQDNPEVKIGKLENGLTYYLAHNEKPKGCAHFYIVHNVGALQEEDNQNGLAHFLEHMAFNGTKNYPGKSILDFLAKDGVRFGYNVNAYTSVCETCYILSDIPLVRESFVDSVMTILHDWSCNISCEQDALDAERGVISEEWRRGDNTLSRISTAQVNLVYKGSKYTERDVIGKYEIINGFKRHEILDFYEKWYRPDLQAVIIVGDFDVNEMEKKVKKLYSTIPVGTDLTPKEEYPIPAMTEPLFENIIDPEVKYQALKVFHRHLYPAKEERYSMDFHRQYFMKQLLNAIIHSRFSKATEATDCPAEIAIAVTNPYMDNFYTTLFTLTPKEENQLEDLLRFYATEVQRLLKHGFTKEEFEMAKATVWKENRLDEEMDRSDIDNDHIVNLCVDNFVRNMPIIYSNDLLGIRAEVLNGVTYDETLAYLPEMFGGNEKIYSYTVATDKTHLLPSKERMKEILAEVEKEDLEPGYLEFKKMNLVTDMKAGSVKKSKALKNMKGELWTLSNGAKVYWLPIDPVKSSTHFAMDARFDTGYKTARQDQIAKTDIAGTYISRELGFGDCTNADIGKDPVCGKIRAFASCGTGRSNMTVLCGKRDVETGMAMFYNYMTRPYFNDENALTQYKDINLRSLSRDKTSMTKFSRERRTARYGDHPWIEYADSATYQSLDMAFIEETFDRNFGNPEDLTVYICTDLDKDTVLPLVEKYVASLEKRGSFKKVKQTPIVPKVKGEVVFDRTYPLTSAPKVDIEYQFLTNVKESLDNKVTYDVLDYIMSLRYLYRIREERGGTYTVSFSSDALGYKNMRQSVISFQTRPEMEEILLKDCQELIDDLCTNGPTADEMDEAAKYLIKANNEKKERNKNLINVRMMDMKECIANGLPLEYDYEKEIKEVTAKDIQTLAKKINNGTRFIAIYREKE